MLRILEQSKQLRLKSTVLEQNRNLGGMPHDAIQFNAKTYMSQSGGGGGGGDVTLLFAT